MTREQVSAAARQACILEASAPKPGNVSPGRPFHDTRYEDFVASAEAIAPEMGRAGERPLGRTILAAVEATARVTRANTNLGIVLLFAPLARAVLGAPRTAASLHDRVRATLASTTVADAADVYAAIRLAHPGGLGAVADQDVREAPTVTLLEAMRLAADRDDVAREYATGFDITFSLAVPALRAARAEGFDWTLAVLDTYLSVLARRPDTLIARKRGRPEAEAVSARARNVQELGGVRTLAGCEAILALDAFLRDETNSRNPGTTADITAAAIFSVLLEG
ncbi:MAG: triphosphoribosyl-dephospho-CoA synthase [Gemmatimonadota bacterium]